MSNYSKKRMLGNFVKNIVSYAIPVAILQFVIQPLIAIKLGPEKNGLYLTIIALVYFLTSTTSAMLAQVRLLKNSEYKEKDIEGDFNVLLLVFSGVIVLVLFVATQKYTPEPTYIDYVFNIIIGLFYLVHDYVSVQYRIELNYTKILFSNICLCLGYLIGIVIFYKYDFPWQSIFIVAYSICLLYDMKNTNCLSERIKITFLFGQTLNKYILLAGAGILAYIVSYGDRIILYPMTDGTTVSIYTTAEIMGKMIMLLSTPMSGFLMAYIVRTDKINLNFSFKTVAIVGIFGVTLYIACVSVGIQMIYLLYPTWADLSVKYIPYTTFISLCNLFSEILNVLVIRFRHSKWQLLINGSYLFIYLCFSLGLLEYKGLIGYCAGHIIAAVIKLIIIIVILKKNTKNE